MALRSASPRVLGLLPVFLVLTLLSCGDGDPPPTPTQPPDATTFDPPPPPPSLPATPPVAFRHVDVVTMGPEGVLLDQTVLVRNAVIETIGADGTVTLPDSTTEIDGTGQFLMPGLADMHTHVSVISSFGQTPDQLSAEEQGVLLIANGVTTILNMGDYERHDLIALRNRWLAGAALGPNMLVGKFIRGPDDSGTSTEIAASADQARTLIRRAWSLDYDFIKVYSRLSAATHEAALVEADGLGLPVFGHLPLTRSLTQALGGG